MNWLFLIFSFPYLQICVDMHEYLPSSPKLALFTFKNQKKLLTAESLQGGKRLRISDGTTWEVAPRDVKKVMAWELPFSLTLRKSGRRDYPYYLTNEKLGMQVLVRSLGRSNMQTPAPQQKDTPPAEPKPTPPSQPSPAKPSDLPKVEPTPHTDRQVSQLVI